MKSTYSVGAFINNCCEIQLASQDLDIFKLDHVNVLLEVRPKQDEYGVFYGSDAILVQLLLRAD